MRIRALASAVLLTGLACARYEWKNELDVPGMCPPVRERVPSRRIAPLTPSASSTQLAGRVLRNDTGQGLGEARVRLTTPHIARLAMTDSAGRFAIDTIPAGLYALEVLRIGFKPLYDTLVLGSAGEPLEIGLSLDVVDGPCSGLIEVRVRKPWWKLW